MVLSTLKALLSLQHFLWKCSVRVESIVELFIIFYVLPEWLSQQWKWENVLILTLKYPLMNIWLSLSIYNHKSKQRYYYTYEYIFYKYSWLYDTYIKKYAYFCIFFLINRTSIYNLHIYPSTSTYPYFYPYPSIHPFILYKIYISIYLSIHISI